MTHEICYDRSDDFMMRLPPTPDKYRSLPVKLREYGSEDGRSIYNIYFPETVRGRFPGIELLANGKDIYSASAAADVIPSPEEIFPIASLHKLVLLMTAIDYMSIDHQRYLPMMLDLIQVQGTWQQGCNSKVVSQLRMKNKRVYIILAHYFAVSWKVGTFCGWLEGKGYDYNNPEDLRAVGWSIAPQAEVICKEMVRKLGQSGRMYIPWVLNVVRELDPAWRDDVQSGMTLGAYSN